MTCHVPLRGGRFALSLALAAVLLAGCTGAADEPGTTERRGASASAAPGSGDGLSEVGEYWSFELGGPHHYAWQQAPTFQFTVAVTGEGAKGRTRDEIDDLVVQAQAALPARLESVVEKQN
ncbi:hypothetical protein ACF1BR_23870 [Streptomyces rubiginosohelvolus]|uniref:hypothetical protein n=1 Tax=Streptomyces rubiginosohelvolus TaxID=67362 RepID=UPI0036FC85C1